MVERCPYSTHRVSSALSRPVSLWRFPNPCKAPQPAACLTRWVVRFGHQVSTSASGRSMRRHIPNPSISVTSLRQAAKMWVGGWDDDDEDDHDGDDEEEDAAKSHGGVVRPAQSWASLGGGLGVVHEEEAGQTEGMSGVAVRSESEMAGHPLR